MSAPAGLCMPTPGTTLRILKETEASSDPLKSVHDPVFDVMKGISYGQSEGVLNSGSIFVLYTGGVTEARRSGRGMAARSGRRRSWGIVIALQPHTVVEGLLENVDAFSGNMEQSGDIKILAVTLG